MSTTAAKPAAPAKNGAGNSNASKSQSRGVAPRPLSTPTDLTAEEVQKVADVVNPIIADHFALYVKTKNFHWHLASSHFRDYHLMFDEQADEIFEAIDLLAERVRKLGAKTITSVGHIARLAQVEDDDDEFVSAPDMIRRLLEDNKASAVTCRAAIEATEDARDFPTSNFLQDILDKAERRIWFLHQVSTGGDHEN